MAEVFAGSSLGSHGFEKPVAVKRLLPELANDHVFVERLIGEAKLLVGMQHGNIVSVLDLAREGEDVFLVMEYVDGPSLRQLLRGRGTRGLPFGIATYIVQAAAAGLEFAHARPGGAVIHADISPSNLLLTTSGEVRVADFGIARREGNGVGVVEGKWAYMAPEQARGEALTPRSDVFALGVVLYELITGQHPLGQKISAEERDSGPIRVVPPGVVNPKIPPGLAAICMRALSDNARDRYPRMQQLIDAIVDERFANGWREGASDLAHAIREISPQGPAVTNGPRTQITDRPVTIVTRSLISQPHRQSSPQIVEPASMTSGARTSQVEMPSTGRTSQVEIPSTGRTSQVELPSALARTSMIEMPPVVEMPMPRVAAPAPDLYRLSAALLPSPELASVHGGHTFTGTANIDVRDTRSNKWTFAVLGLAALLGGIAAIAIQLAPSENSELAEQATRTQVASTAPIAIEEPTASPTEQPTAPPTEQPTATPIEQAIATPTVAEAVEPTPAPTVVAAPAVDPAPERIVARKSRPAPVAKRAAVADAVLRVATHEGVWAWAYVGKQRQDVPGAKFKVAAGNYVVKLRNTDLGVTRTCPVKLESGQVRTVKVDMEGGGCEVY